VQRIPCPFCGPRDEREFAVRGDATLARPPAEGNAEAQVEDFFGYVYLRQNPLGWRVEWWQHVGGCRQWLKVLRNTQTHEIRDAATAGAHLEPPP